MEVKQTRLAVPKVCPHLKKPGAIGYCEIQTFMKGTEVKHPTCHEDDYLNCSVFSKWYWEGAKKV